MLLVMEFGEWLTKKLTERKMSARSLARKAGVSHPTILRALSGHRPSSILCNSIADALDLPREIVCGAAGRTLGKELEPDIIEIVEAAQDLNAEQRRQAAALLRVLKEGPVIIYSGKRKE